jgi:hypothetical protein
MMDVMAVTIITIIQMAVMVHIVVYRSPILQTAVVEEAVACSVIHIIAMEAVVGKV